MQYVGGKTRIAKDILALVNKMRGDRTTYIEPFVGGGSVFELVAPTFPNAIAGDLCLDLVLLWQAAAHGWAPPGVVTEEEYAAAKKLGPSAYRGFIGFGCSFGAKWFGGYARNKRGDDYAGQASRSVQKRGKAFSGRDVFWQPYWDFDSKVTSDSVVYCDIPYKDTLAYGAVDKFDHEKFWSIAHDWTTRGAVVLVSEYAAPEPWTPVFVKSYKPQLDAKKRNMSVEEKVFSIV